MTGDDRIPVGVLGATGAVGQRFVTLLADHPWFHPVYLAASERSVGRPYGEAARWAQVKPISEKVFDVTVEPVDPARTDAPLIFSALGGAVAGPVETAFARAGRLVVSNARSHRMDPTVPLVVPEVNPEHLALLDRREGTGGIVTNPNCSTIGLVIALAPLHRRFGVRAVDVVTLQALSGAGIPGVPALEIADNVLPRIAGEEEKLTREPHKIFGTLDEGGVVEASFPVSAQCTRVPVSDGHLACVSVSLEGSPDVEEIRSAWEAWRPNTRGLPSAPERALAHLEGPDAPQPRLHRGLGRGMTVSVGRLREDPLRDARFVCLSHNTLRGAAGGALLCAELAASLGRIPGCEAPA